MGRALHCEANFAVALASSSFSFATTASSLVATSAAGKVGLFCAWGDCSTLHFLDCFGSLPRRVAAFVRLLLHLVQLNVQPASWGGLWDFGLEFESRKKTKNRGRG